ncbi:MAG: hypothetical protein KAY22_12480 [Rhizorhabdus sp.]|uniref:hypothetical protein n=1 Tax=Rhizorhabdus sp. TaxID=1968843 RepID=UPI001B7BFEA8|nr:hypothetical protein [Rhizorhabdus sp.]MBP8233115.1 hypothetical protein [Rhizorhabdus sp.]
MYIDITVTYGQIRDALAAADDDGRLAATDGSFRDHLLIIKEVEVDDETVFENLAAEWIETEPEACGDRRALAGFIDCLLAGDRSGAMALINRTFPVDADAAFVELRIREHKLA